MTARAILFDLGETLWHFPVPLPPDAYHRHAAAQIGPLLADWGVAADCGALSRRLLAEVQRVWMGAKGRSLLSPSFEEIVDGVCAELGLRLEGEQCAQLWGAWQVDRARLGRQLYPDALTTLAWARSSGYRVGLVTNGWSGRAALLNELAGCTLASAFDVIAVSADVGWLKPHPEIFYAALDALGAEAEETVMVGNRLDADIAGAKLLGMRAVWKRNGRRDQRDAAALAPDAMIDDLWELRRLPFLAKDGDALSRLTPPAPRDDGERDWRTSRALS